jgi:hypothetical protein
MVTGYSARSRALHLDALSGETLTPVNVVGPDERRLLFRRTPQGLEPLALWLSADGIPKIHSWQDTIQAANARIQRVWTACAGEGVAPLFFRAHMAGTPSP